MQRHTRKIIEHYHGRIKGCGAAHQECAAPHKENGLAVPRRMKGCAAPHQEDEGRQGVAHRRGDEECAAWFGINYSNYREKTSPNDLWRCMVAITSCTIQSVLSAFHYSLQEETTRRLLGCLKQEGYFS